MVYFLNDKLFPIRNIVGCFSNKWSIFVLATLNANGTMRFNEIQKSIGDVSQRMLTVTLRSLEADGFIEREVYPEVPPRVEYRLSELGNGFMPHLNNLLDWALKNM